MTITIPPELETRVRKRAQAEGLSVEAYIERLLREDEDWAEQTAAPVDDNDPEFGEIRRAVLEGLEQAERGESSPAEDVFAELRTKHGIPR